MSNDLVKRFIKKDGSQRISFYRDEYAENPRDNTDGCDGLRAYTFDVVAATYLHVLD